MRFVLTVGILMTLINVRTFGQKRVESIKEILTSKQVFQNLDSSLLNIGLYKFSDSQYKYRITEQLYSYSKNRDSKSIKLALVKARMDNGNEYLLYYEIYKENKEKIVYSSFCDSANIESTINRYKKAGLSTIHIEDELTYGQIDSEILGYGCGFLGSSPYHGEILLEILKERNIDRLFRWLSSINPVKQAYGYLGVTILIAKGTVLSDLEKKMYNDFIESGYNKYFEIETCSGCLYGISYSLMELPETDFMKSLIQAYSKEI